MREIYTTNTKTNLCNTCLKCFAECRPAMVKFGNGIGTDNVIKCSGYNGKITEGMEIGKIMADAFDKIIEERR